MRRGRHGHGQPLPVFFNVDGLALRDNESLTRYLNKDLEGSIKEFGAPLHCCSKDPLYEVARQLAQRYGIDEAEWEPGFQGLQEDIARVLANSLLDASSF